MAKLFKRFLGHRTVPVPNESGSLQENRMVSLIVKEWHGVLATEAKILKRKLSLLFETHRRDFRSGTRRKHRFVIKVKRLNFIGKGSHEHRICDSFHGSTRARVPST